MLFSVKGCQIGIYLMSPIICFQVTLARIRWGLGSYVLHKTEAWWRWLCTGSRNWIDLYEYILLECCLCYCVYLYCNGPWPTTLFYIYTVPTLIRVRVSFSNSYYTRNPKQDFRRWTRSQRNTSITGLTTSIYGIHTTSPSAIISMAAKYWTVNMHVITIIWCGAKKTQPTTNARENRHNGLRTKQSPWTIDDAKV